MALNTQRRYREKPKYGWRSNTWQIIGLGVASLFILGIFLLATKQSGNKRIRAQLMEVDFKEQPYYVSMSATTTRDTAAVASCTPDQASFQASNIAAAKVRGCPPEDDMWMRLIHLLMPKPGVGSHGIFIDIGSNKGFTAARWFQLWNPEMGMSPPTLASLLKQVSSDKQVRECGACGDCHDDKEPFTDLGLRLCGEASMKTANGNYRPRLEKAIANVCSRRLHNYRPIRVYSFDGNEVLVDAVNAAKTKFASSGRHVDKQYLEDYVRSDAVELFETHWTVELAAFSDKYVPGETMTFMQNGELGHIVSDVVSEGDRPEANRGGKAVKVPVLTVDQLVTRDTIQHVDFLKIDTEGHDMTVLQGAKETIAKRAVTVIMFEFNEFWPRTAPQPYHSALEYVVKDLLAPHDYVCYLEGKNVMVRLTHCWDPAMDSIKQWSNVWCAQAQNPIGQAIVSVFDSYALAFQ